MYTPKDTKDIQLMKRVTAGNDYTFFRDDGVLFDAAGCAGALRVEGQRGIALGHLINHPPPGRHVNCAPLAFDGGGSWPQHVKQLIPNTMFAPLLPHQQPRGSCVPMLLMVTTDHVAAGDELFMEYRFNPKLRSAWPAWYHAVDEAALQRRWSVASLFQ